MPDIHIRVNGKEIRCSEGTSVAAAVLLEGQMAFRHSVTGQPRGPLCGMGICFECRVTIDGIEHCRSCQTVVRDGMEVCTT